MKTHSAFLLIYLGLFVAQLHSQTLDVDFTGNTGNCMAYTGLSETQTIAQSFTAGITGTLTSVKAGLSSDACTETTSMNCVAKIYQGTCTGSLLATQNFSLPTGASLSMHQITFSTPASVVSGQLYTLELSVLPGQNCAVDMMDMGMQPVFAGWHLENQYNCGGQYAEGTAYDPGCVPYPGDYYIQTYVSGSGITTGKVSTFDTQLTAYPNPTQRELLIDLGESLRSVKVTLTDLSGRMLQSNEYTYINKISYEIDQQPGLYLLIVATEEKQSVIRVVKQ